MVKVEICTEIRNFLKVIKCFRVTSSKAKDSCHSTMLKYCAVQPHGAHDKFICYLQHSFFLIVFKILTIVNNISKTLRFNL